MASYLAVVNNMKLVLTIATKHYPTLFLYESVVYINNEGEQKS